MNTPIMAHLVLGYPDLATSYATALAYADAGLQYLEVQLPFSHPTADGPTLTDANRIAVQQGITVADCLAWLQRLRQERPQATIIPMTYANKLFGHGLDQWAAWLLPLGIDQLIVPDLPFDTAEAAELRAHGLHPVPVLAPNAGADRLDQLTALQPRLIYLMAGYRLTGQAFALDDRLRALVQDLHQRIPGVQVGIGFGISTAAEAAQVLYVADFAIIGSALLRAQQDGHLPFLLNSLQRLATPAAVR